MLWAIVLAYALLKFILDVELNFIHIYAVLFIIEVSIMLLIGYYRPLDKAWSFRTEAKVDLSHWRYAIPASSTMVMGIILVYLLFSPIGLVGGISSPFWISVALLVFANLLVCKWALSRYDRGTV